MKTIHMGLNTEPAWLHADDTIRRWEAEGNQKMVDYWKDARRLSLCLKDEIVKALLADGEVRLSWSCTGRTRHTMHAMQWKEAMPEYDFTIGDNYECIVRLKGE